MRTRITLACTECKQRNYNTTKDKKAHPDRMEILQILQETHGSQRDEIKRGFRMSNEQKAPKIKFFDGVKAEFKKIIWPDKNTLLKQSVAVVIVSIAMGVVIAVLDMIMQYGINFLTM